MKHNKIITVCALLHIQLLSGSSLRDQVHQTPPDMFTQQGQKAQIQCSHRIQNYDQILWYKQTDGRLELLGYMYIDNPTLEREVNVKIEGNAEKDQNCTLTVEKLTVSSSAVYYCAASNTVLHITAAQHKNLHNTHINAAQVHDTWKPSCQQEVGYLMLRRRRRRRSWEGLSEEGGVELIHCFNKLMISLSPNAGSSLSDQVHQSPPDMFSDPGNSIKINCSHTNQNFNRILWYKQSERRLQLLGYMVGDSAAPETGQDVKIEGNANKDQTCTLTVEKLTNMDVISWKQTLLTLSVFVLGMAGLIDGSDVNQPELLWEEQGKEATISCNHTKDATYYQMYWYRQLPGETMKLIVFTTLGSEDHDFGDFRKDKFSATKPDAQSGTFTVKNLLPEDNGVYFCANPASIFKNPGESVTGDIKCSHNITFRDVILWYRQDENRALKLLGYVNNRFANPEEDHFLSLSLHQAPAVVLKHNMDTVIKLQLIISSALLLWNTGLVDGSDVNQPELLWEEQGKEATISCNHTKDITYTQMYWYRQLPGETMKLIVFTMLGSQDHDFGDFSKDKFSATKPDAQSGTFTVKNLLPEDNGVYFCAVSEHSDEDDSGSCTKTHLEKRQQYL
ncbi:uncharacterized protein V6R79_012416 [Siganus canaliculatus]